MFRHYIELVNENEVRFGWYCTADDRGGSEIAFDQIAGAGDWDRIFTGQSPPTGLNNRWRIVDVDNERMLYGIEAVEVTLRVGGKLIRDGVRVYASRQSNVVDHLPDIWTFGGSTWTYNGATWAI